jgi:hypothetical protein
VAQSLAALAAAAALALLEESTIMADCNRTMTAVLAALVAMADTE